jgi:hypothetical protein
MQPPTCIEAIPSCASPRSLIVSSPQRFVYPSHLLLHFSAPELARMGLTGSTMAHIPRSRETAPRDADSQQEPSAEVQQVSISVHESIGPGPAVSQTPTPSDTYSTSVREAESSDGHHVPCDVDEITQLKLWDYGSPAFFEYRLNWCCSKCAIHCTGIPCCC